MAVAVSGALLDTSVLIGSAEGVGELPERSAISVISVGELRAGVLRALDPAARRLRQARLDAIRRHFEPLPVDDAVAERYGDALARARDEGRAEKATDLLIIATAAATNRTLVTLDQRQARLARRMDLAVVGPR